MGGGGEANIAVLIAKRVQYYLTGFYQVAIRGCTKTMIAAPAAHPPLRIVHCKLSI
jgi:hypothetical protein